ncbi:MAG: 30S ribosomal protein S11 [Berkelbacteria bacterium GW2011_GWA2_35_9]|uniref:Small ribosomal subunit protein uS11 n=1 Tax=Berkelbacteria bacterium GW2011_GWA2_35_9 TaxID=1618333 RepID=A0A0G0D4S3_9BACT|nr:MAG: 30S ribosomal protein S11 [Berkelbacteria bacterium GW2011_GWA2_35_9]
MKKNQKKVVKIVNSGKIFISASFNNTIISITDIKGNVISWATAGSSGFKGTKKSTPFASGSATKIALDKALALGLKEIEVYVKGVGSGRDAAVRAIASTGLKITKIKDTTPIPHNGPRPKKPRRV